MPAVPNSGQSGGQRLLWLDGARGVAAIAVMCYHYEDLLKLRPLLTSAYLAVDLFFMMSGFVLSQSYEKKLQSGQMKVGHYMVHRAIRLYPTYLVATGVGLAYYLSKIVLHTDDAPHIIDLMRIVCSNLLFIPVTMTTLVPQGMFPFAPSSWSLATEVVASILYGLVLAQFRAKLILGLIGVLGCVFIWCVLRYHTFDLGWDITNFIPGVFRTLFEFTIGIALYRLSITLIGKPFLKPTILLMAVSVILILSLRESLLISSACIVVLFPVFIISTVRKPVHGFLNLVFHQLGRVSYPVYLLHTPVLLWFAGAYKFIAKQDPLAMNVRWLGWAMVIGTLVLSYIVAKWIDEPARAWLNAKTRSGRSSPVSPRT